MKAGTTAAACVAILRRDLALTWVRRGDALNPLMFAIIVVALFPFALGPEAETLARIAAGTIFVAVLLAGLLSLDTLFRSDLEDGSLEQLVLSPHPLSLLLACKIAVHWLTTALPLIAIAPLLAQLLHLPDHVLPVLIAALAMATPLLSLIGAVCVALTIGMRRSGMLLTLLVLPLIVPVLIFGAGACNAAQLGLPYGAPLLWLGAWLVMALVLAPLASATALKISLT
jgi:heme exporter protein B